MSNTDERTQDPEGRKLVQTSSTSDTPELDVKIESALNDFYHNIKSSPGPDDRRRQVYALRDYLKSLVTDQVEQTEHRRNAGLVENYPRAEQELEDAADIVYAEMIWIMEAYFNAMGQHGLPIVDATTLIERLNAWRSKSVLGALRRVKYRLPDPNNNVEEWRGHNLGLSQAFSVIDQEIERIEALTKDKE